MTTADRIQAARVHGSLYTDPDQYTKELERIWFGGWVCVGHESELPQVGDTLAKAIGPRAVVVRRSAAGLEIDGVLHVGIVCGFVFACCADTPPCSLLDHLGDAVGTLERLAGLSPEGRVRLDCGWLRHTVQANWKMVLENEVDGYHPSFVHASIFGLAKGPLSDLFGDKSSARARELGRGHSELELSEQFRAAGTLSWVGSTPEKMPQYMAAMADAYGPEGEQRVTDGPPHVMIFPNLFIAEIQVFIIQPVGPTTTVQHVTALQYDGGRELNRKLLRQTVGSVGPAGLLLADDAEMYERNQRGVRAHGTAWLDLRRGMHREYTDADGHRSGHVTDEVTQRSIWRHYRELMA